MSFLISLRILIVRRHRWICNVFLHCLLWRVTSPRGLIRDKGVSTNCLLIMSLETRVGGGSEGGGTTLGENNVGRVD